MKKDLTTYNLPMFLNNKTIVFGFNSTLGEQPNKENVAQASLFNYIKDNKGNTFAIVMNFYDNRFNSFTPFVSNDTYTAFVSTPMENTQFLTVLEPSSTEPYKSTVFISSDNFSNILKQMNEKCILNCIKWDMDISKYNLTSVGILHEVFELNPNINFKSELQVNGLQISR